MKIQDVSEDGVGMDGMDPVAAANGELLNGESSLNSAFDGVTYWFASEENMEKFEEDPSRYIPLAGNPATGDFTSDASADAHGEYPVTNRALEDQEFASKDAPDAPAFGDEEADDEDLARQNLVNSEV